jgi:hypothetical protein
MKQLRIVTAVCAVSLSIALVNAEDQFLFNEGKAYAEIIIGESSARLALAALQTYVAKISGGRLPIKAEAEDGMLFIIYDHQRYILNRAGKRGVGSFVMVTFREADIRAARARLRAVITQLWKANELPQSKLKSESHSSSP